KNQPIFYEDCTISVAEVASTFFENILFDYVFPTLSEKEKTTALFGKIQDDMGTIFRQIAFYNYEKEMHALVREKGGLSKDEFAVLYSKHLKMYLGSAFKLTEDDGYGYVYIPHFRDFFYVYSYAYGQLISKAMYEKYKKDPMFIEKVKKFLSAGGSMSPEDIFKSIGIDTSKPEFFEGGLRSIDSDIKLLEKLAKEAGMIK
ncbi:MAG: M3 family metallopeptidase, partial [Patescibacteria group bacterium]